MVVCNCSIFASFCKTNYFKLKKSSVFLFVFLKKKIGEIIVIVAPSCSWATQSLRFEDIVLQRLRTCNLWASKCHGPKWGTYILSRALGTGLSSWYWLARTIKAPSLLTPLMPVFEGREFTAYGNCQRNISKGNLSRGPVLKTRSLWRSKWVNFGLGSVLGFYCCD